jgi:hypothetical protein
MPNTVGVPLMVIVLFAQDAVTPAGKFVAFPIPVALIVVILILVNGVLIHRVWFDPPPMLSLNCAIFPADSAEL